MSTTKKANNKRDFILILIVLAAAMLLFFAFQRPAVEGPVAVVSVNGKNVLQIELETAQDQLIALQASYGVPVSLEIKNHRLRFVHVTCPDHICEAAGFLSRNGDTAVCMPNKTAVFVQDGKVPS